MSLYNEEMIALITGKDDSLLIKIFKNPLFKILQTSLEVVMLILLNLPIPIYSTFIKMLMNNLPGLPNISGCYLRSLYYKPKLKKMGKNVIIEQYAILSHPKNIELSDFSFIDKYVMIASASAKIGRRVHIAPNTIITGGGDFIIDDYAGISNGCSIITATETLKDGTRASGPMIPKSQRDVLRGFVHIKKDAFLGTKAVVMTNVTVAEGSVIGSGVIMNKSTEPWKIYVSEGGKPKILRDRKELFLEDI